VTRPRLRTAALVASAVVLAGGAGAAGYVETRALRNHRGPAPTATRPAPPAVLGAATASPSTATATDASSAVAAAVTRALAGPLAAGALGGTVRAQVADVATGAVLYGQHASAPAAPASTAKLLTATAVLACYSATHRFTTRAVAGSGGALVLVGGGDPTLTAVPAGRPGAYPDAARLSDLAAQLRAAHVQPSRIVVDDTLFTGPSVSPAWDATDVPSSYGAAITPLMVDGGRAAPHDTVRSATPDLAAGHALAALLGKPALPVVRGTAPAGAQSLAAVQSAPLGQLVEQMLQASDNVIADVLARQVAIARHLPASFTGAATAIRDELGALGVQVDTGMHDGSGLAASDRLSAATLTAVLRLAAGPAHPELHAVLAGLPVAAWSGTLADRYLAGSGDTAGAGTVRAKTGTLTGVSSLAGLVHTRDGDLLAFAFLANGVAATPAADAALDAAASTLASCGCS
jgi:D-alanyl-D-alanine carboxypeptidase/D-alanyl-D-alanine-endopeptidase (penicillin-binding protein 4)